MNKTCNECIYGQWANEEGVDVCETCVHLSNFKQFLRQLLPIVTVPGEEGVE